MPAMLSMAARKQRGHGLLLQSISRRARRVPGGHWMR